MSTTTTARGNLRARLEDQRSRLRDLRAEQARARRQADEARDRFAADGKSASPDDPLYVDALAARRRLDGVTADLEAARDQEVKLLELLGEGQGGRRPHAIANVDEPGGWLAAIAASGGLHAEAIPGLTTDDGLGSRTDVGLPFVDRLSTASAILASGPTVVDIDTTEIKVPRLSGRLEPAPVVPELEPIPEVEAPLDTVTIRPPKIARLAVLSEEAWTDARPATLAGHERELVRSVAGGFDVAAFHGVEGDEGLPGILGTSGIAEPPTEGPLDSLDPFVDGIAALRSVGARATAIYLHPMTWARLGKLRKHDGSNEPLVSAELVTEGPRESLLGVPVYQSEHLDEDVVVVAQASELLVVRRTGVEVRIAENFKFAEAGVGVRVIWRAALVVPQPEAVAVLHLEGQAS